MRIGRIISSLLLAAAIVAPAVVVPEASAQEVAVVRVYDRDHRDYHNWDGREERAYRRYLVEYHRPYCAYRRQRVIVQRNYWGWRHTHPDRY
jgi:hypothetical protein